LGRFGPLLGRPWPLLGCSWTALELLLAALGAPCAAPESLLAALAAFLGALGRSWAALLFISSIHLFINWAGALHSGALPFFGLRARIWALAVFRGAQSLLETHFWGFQRGLRAAPGRPRAAPERPRVAQDRLQTPSAAQDHPQRVQDRIQRPQDRPNAVVEAATISKVVLPPEEFVLPFEE